jgi:hypothetical protein
LNIDIQEGLFLVWGRPLFDGLKKGKHGGDFLKKYLTEGKQREGGRNLEEGRAGTMQYNITVMLQGKNVSL